MTQLSNSHVFVTKICLRLDMTDCLCGQKTIIDLKTGTIEMSNSDHKVKVMEGGMVVLAAMTGR